MISEMRSLGSLIRFTPRPADLCASFCSSADALPTMLRSVSPRVLDAIRLEGRPLGTGHRRPNCDLARPIMSRHLQALRDLGLVVWDGRGPKGPACLMEALLI